MHLDVGGGLTPSECLYLELLPWRSVADGTSTVVSQKLGDETIQEILALAVVALEAAQLLRLKVAWAPRARQNELFIGLPLRPAQAAIPLWPAGSFEEALYRHLGRSVKETISDWLKWDSTDPWIHVAVKLMERLVQAGMVENAQRAHPRKWLWFTWASTDRFYRLSPSRVGHPQLSVQAARRLLAEARPGVCACLLQTVEAGIRSREVDTSD